MWFVNLFVQGLLKLCASKPTPEASNDADAGGTALAGARGPVLPRQAPGDAREPVRPRIDHRRRRDDAAQPDPRDRPRRPSRRCCAQQLATSYHTRLPAYEDELDNIVGILHLKQVVAAAARRRTRRRTPALDPAPRLFRARRARRCSPSCSSSRPTASGSGSSSTNTASCRAW